MIEDSNFYKSVLMSRVVALVGGASFEAAERWLQTPHRDFNLRTPESFLNDREWMILRDWLVTNVSGQFANDVDYYAVAQNAEQYTTSLVTGEGMDAFQDLTNTYIVATGGTRSVLTLQQGGPRSRAAYIIHTFTSNGTFRVERGGRIEFLIVGGGGGGGAGTAAQAGGGGAGGQVLIGTTVITANPYNIVIGAGGSAGNDVGDARVNGNGGDSSAFGFTAWGGGAGGTPVTVMNTGEARTRASGGGGSSEVTAGALGTNGRGFAGGNGIGSGTPAGGGGGGAGAAGVSATNIKAGDGGIGISNNIVGILPIPHTAGGENNFFTGTEIFYGGGGGGGATGPGLSSQPIIGGAGGRGGGGTARNSNDQGVGAAGSANTGGGGAGGSGAFNGGAGGSGIVIIRYRVA